MSLNLSRRLPAYIVAGIACVAFLGMLGYSLWAKRIAQQQTNSTVRPRTDAAVTKVERPSPRPGGYVGSAACAQCHADVAKLYDGHPMAHSMAYANEAKPIEDFAHAEFKAGKRTYRVEKTAEGLVHHELLLDSDGKPIYDQAEKTPIVLGSGIRGRSYLLNRDGYLFMSPIGWYSQKGQWALSPGYAPDSEQRFERRITDGCLYCHVGRTAPREAPADTYENPPLLEASIGCERCHGPGKQHVEKQAAAATATGRDESIVNPVRLPTSKREAVCNECHLQGESIIMRYGRTVFDFRPGDHLEDTLITFVNGDKASATTRAVSQVEQMRVSRCYLGSNGKMGCTTCHEPHSRPKPEDRPAFYKTKCFTCHDDHSCSLPKHKQDAAPASGSCIHCHMQRLTAADIPHTASIDHQILRKPATESKPARRIDPRKLVIFDDGEQRMPQWEVDRARGLMLSLRSSHTSDEAVTQQAADLLEATIKVVPDDVEVWSALGSLAAKSQNDDLATQAWNRALAIDPMHERSLASLALYYHSRGNAAHAEEFFERLIDVDPYLAHFHGRRAQVLGQLNSLPQAIAEAERGLQLDPTMTQLREWLAQAYELSGQPEKAAQQKELLQRLKAVDGGDAQRAGGAGN